MEEFLQANTDRLSGKSLFSSAKSRKIAPEFATSGFKMDLENLHRQENLA